ncbi:UNVERIFIED_CONTAM: Allantoinase [Sesamum indicum]
MKSGKLRLLALLPVLASLILLYFDIFPQIIKILLSPAPHEYAYAFLEILGYPFSQIGVIFHEFCALATRSVVSSYRTRCSLIEYRHYWIASKRIVTPSAIISGAVEVKGGKIKSIVEGDDWRANTWSKQVIDYGEAVIMPGLIDVHTHLDDPGRTEWEGFPSGTRAAAAGCIFISGNGLISFDHPLNKVRGIPREDEEGNISAVIFQVDLFTRLHSIPRSGSAANWANATVVEGE